MAKSEKRNSERTSFWRAIFNQSRVNGAPYRGEYLPAHSWIWPRGTFLQRRLRSIRAQEPGDVSSEYEAGDEIATVFERIDRAAAARLRLVPDPVSVAGEPDVSEPHRDVPRDKLTLALNRTEHAKPSPTQALLGLEREGWARVSNGAMQRVEVNENSVQAALRKENMEKFQQTLVQSGQWVRSSAAPAAPEPPQAVDLEPVAAAKQANDNAPSQPVQVAAASVQVAAPVASAVTTLPIREAAAQMSSQKSESTTPASRAESRPAAPPSAPQTMQPLPGWDDIDEKLLWLAKPSN